MNPNKQPALVLYSLTGTTNLVESATNLTKTIQWQPYQKTVMTNLYQVFQPIVIPSNRLFFRATSKKAPSGNGL